MAAEEGGAQFVGKRWKLQSLIPTNWISVISKYDARPWAPVRAR